MDKEVLEGVCVMGGEVGIEVVVVDVFYMLFIGERRYCGGGEVFRELFLEEDEVGKVVVDGGCFVLEGGEGGL